MIAFGARCSFGDQLHPSGEMDLATYRNIGQALPLRGADRGATASTARPCANLGLWLCGHATAHDQGTANMLLETQTDFEVVGPATDLRASRPSSCRGPRASTRPAARQLDGVPGAAAGKLLVLGEGALDRDAQAVPARRRAPATLGPAGYELDYLVAGEALREGARRRRRS